ncbi:hypothetical protein Tco_0012968 [Tanacetum coccineum]
MYCGYSGLLQGSDDPCARYLLVMAINIGLRVVLLDSCHCSGCIVVSSKVSINVKSMLQGINDPCVRYLLMMAINVGLRVVLLDSCHCSRCIVTPSKIRIGHYGFYFIDLVYVKYSTYVRRFDADFLHVLLNGHGVVLLRIRASVSLRLVDHRGSLLENFLVFHPWIVKKVVKLYLIE